MPTRSSHCWLLPVCVFAILPAILLAAAEPADKSADKPAVSDDSSSTTRPKTTFAERTAARKAARDEAAKAKTEKEREEWLARVKANKVTPWPENESDDVHEKALTKSRKMADEVVSLLPGTAVIETEHFLFVTNIPQQQSAPYIASVDRMYDWMAQLYGVPRDHKVWLGGKALIFAFLEHAQFDAFEEKYYPKSRESLGSLAMVYGLCHSSGDGEVVISCFRGNDPFNFGQMLVHETSHGFIHRYKTKATLPSWVNEGMADLIGAEMVPASTAVKSREQRAIMQLAQQNSLGGLFESKRIEPFQYGMASNLNRFMLQRNRTNYVHFIEALKEGQKWEDALKTAYHSTPTELLTAYGRQINVPDLQP